MTRTLEDLLAPFGGDDLWQMESEGRMPSRRFELGGGDDGTRAAAATHAQALTRASSLAEVLGLLEPSSCIALLARSSLLAHDIEESRVRLEAAGVAREDFRRLGETVDKSMPEDEDWITRVWHVAQGLSKRQVQGLLWMHLASELPIAPSLAGFDLCLINPQTATGLMIYDDRGAFAFAQDDTRLRPAFERFHDWRNTYHHP